jgi:hypothetical protein
MRKFSELLSYFQNLHLEPRLLGFFNVESGIACASTAPRIYCSCTEVACGPANLNCDQCGRGSNSYLQIPAGDGDGVYPVFSLENKVQRLPHVALTVFDRGYGFVRHSAEIIESERVPEFRLDQLVLDDELELIELTALEKTSRIWFGDRAAGLNGKHVVVDAALEADQDYVLFAATKKVSQLR